MTRFELMRKIGAGHHQNLRKSLQLWIVRSTWMTSHFHILDSKQVLLWTSLSIYMLTSCLGHSFNIKRQRQWERSRQNLITCHLLEFQGLVIRSENLFSIVVSMKVSWKTSFLARWRLRKNLDFSNKIQAKWDFL